MKTNDVLKTQILEVVDNQIRDNNPEETRLTYERLVGLGFSDTESKQLIGKCVSIEIFDVLKNQTPFNEIRFIENLEKLPKKPFN